MSRRTPRPAPELPGYTYLEPVGAGGYADVYLYEQHMPQRRVAVKVLDTTSLPAGADHAAFTHEANVMAMVSAHPYIVQVFHAAIAPDRRPYLVMEYYPGPNFYDRARTERLDVAEVLRVGVQLSAAVETAHRAGILHRDIKPANVLTSAYRRPGLTDFGIAATQGPHAAADALSVPWSPPEAFGGHSDQRSDVYSLAATLHTLLTGRSPFELPGGDNAQLALVARIEHQPVPSVGRSDAPASLDRLLARAMAKQPTHRPQSAAEFGRLLQAVESELHLAVTPLELAEDGPGARLRIDDTDADSTRVKAITEISAQGPSISGPLVTSGPSGHTGGTTTGPGYGGASIGVVPPNPVGVGGPVLERRREGILAEPEISETIHRGRPATPDLPAPTPPAGPPKVLYVALAVGVALAVVVAIVFLLGRDSKQPDRDDDQLEQELSEVNDDIGLGEAQPVRPIDPTGITVFANPDGTFTIEWPPAGDDAAYLVIPDGETAATEINEPTFTSSSACVEIQVIAADGRLSATTATPACSKQP